MSETLGTADSLSVPETSDSGLETTLSTASLSSALRAACSRISAPSSVKRRLRVAVFAELKFDVKFTIAEVVVMAPNWAYVRTNSAGTTGHASTGTTTAEANQELFIFKKGEDGRWRIARYSFSPTNPPKN